jgi:hypothetical protein
LSDHILYIRKGETDQGCDCRISAPPVIAPLLINIASDDIFYYGIADLTDGELDGSRNGGSDGDCVCESENRPCVVDSSEVGVFCVGKYPALDELSANDCVLAGLIGKGIGLSRKY